jgi:ABC-type multidrug transport system fused ATPase/permease subunit
MRQTMQLIAGTFLLLFSGSVSAFFVAPPSRIVTIASSATRAPGQLFSTIASPTETDEVFGTVVGDTKGAVLRLTNVAISRGATPLLKNIEWSVQPDERWGIVGINGAGKVRFGLVCVGNLAPV